MLLNEPTEWSAYKLNTAMGSGVGNSTSYFLVQPQMAICHTSKASKAQICNYNSFVRGRAKLNSLWGIRVQIFFSGRY